jgi:hypothetical protein
MQLAILAYVPPPSLTSANSQVFLDHIRAWRTTHPLLLFSDCDWPDTIRLKTSPEIVKERKDKEGNHNQWGVNNMIFYTAVRIAQMRGISQFIYLETDCRVGRHDWDSVVFDEFFSQPKALACGGSLVTYNPCNAGPIAHRRWGELVSINAARNYPIPTYGFRSAADGSGSSVFPNGALGVYDTQFMIELFPEIGSNETVSLAANTFAWDFAIGDRLWKKLGHESYDAVAHLRSVFSSFGEVLTTEADRLAMLKAGTVVAVHQVKSATPCMP